MTKYVEATVRVPVRESHENEPDETFEDVVRIVPSDIYGVHSIILNGDVLTDSLAQVVDVKVVEE